MIRWCWPVLISLLLGAFTSRDLAQTLKTRTAEGPQSASTPAPAPSEIDLPRASSEDLLKIYTQLRTLQGSNQSAVTENISWKKDAAVFTFKNGRLTFAAPVAGHVVAAVFTGEATFEIDPPDPIDRQQISRYGEDGKLVDTFREATFFFTDNSWEELQKLVIAKPLGDAGESGKALANIQSRYSQDLNAWWNNAYKGNPVVRNLAARMLADLSDPTSHGLFLADLKTAHHDNLIYQVSWNRDSLVSPLRGWGSIDSDEEVMLVHYKHDQYAEWYSGFHLTTEYARHPHPEHRTLLAHCLQENIDAEVAKDNRISATASLNFVVTSAPARVLPFNLEGVLRISSITDDAGRKLSFVQEDRQLDSDPWLILPAPAAAGKAYKVKIAYEEDSTRDSRIIHQQGAGLYYVGARSSWYPSFGAFDDRTNFHLHFLSPKKFKFVATGHQLSETKGKNALETEWESEIPYRVVGFNYGDFVEKTDKDTNLSVTAYAGRDIPDELKNLEGRISTADLAGGVGHPDVASQYGILAGGFNTASGAQYAAGQSFQAFKLFEHYFSNLPFQTISVTEQPIRGFGQSWPTLIYLPWDSLLDSTTRHSLRLDTQAESREFFRVVAVHEMSHQWWGHMVGWKTYHDQWLSEGFAEFSAGIYIKTFEPKTFKAFWDLKRKWLLEGNRSGHRPADVAPLWLNYSIRPMTISIPQTRCSFATIRVLTSSRCCALSC